MNDDNIDILSEKEQRYDEMLLNILQNEGKIQPFIDNIFRFLYRRTDFYLIQEKADQAYGFPPGVSEQIVRNAFRKYDSFSKEKLKEKLGLRKTDQVLNKTLNKPKNRVEEPQPQLKQKIDELKDEEKNVSTETSHKENLLRQQKIFQSNSASYNGAIRDNYSWTQSIKDIDIQVKVNSNMKSSKDVKIKIEKESLQVSIKETDGSWKFLINDKLPWKIKVDECTWTLFPGDHIHIYLEKTGERWWEQLLISEEKLELSNMNPEKPIEDLDQESQAKIKQMMFDEHQKKLGLPTSEQVKTNEMLRKAWDCEGSPFKGQPFDPSLVMSSNEMAELTQ